MEEIVRLATLIQKRNEVDSEIAAIIGRPSLTGHLGEFIAARVFDIQLVESASHKSIDGYFRSGALAGGSVNVKWYGKQEGLLDITSASLPDYYLVMTGPRSTALTSRNGSRPLLIDLVYLFDARALVEALSQGRAKIGIATSVRKHLWEQAELYPDNRNPLLVLSDEQRGLLRLFSTDALERPGAA